MAGALAVIDAKRQLISAEDGLHLRTSDGRMRLVHGRSCESTAAFERWAGTSLRHVLVQRDGAASGAGCRRDLRLPAWRCELSLSWHDDPERHLFRRRRRDWIFRGHS
jgi:hypothetical protein